MQWISMLEDATSRFAAMLDDGDLTAEVPSCPGWTLAELGEHLRTVHLWAAHAVARRSPDGDPPAGALDRATLTAGYRSAAAHLVSVLRAAGPDGPAWTFGPAPVAGFWWRRQVHETTLHLYDALAALGREREWGIAPDLAWDGVAEVAEVFYPRQVRLGRTEPLPGSLTLAPSDVDAPPVVLGAPGHGRDARLAGTAAYLLLALWKRLPASDAAAAELLSGRVTP